MASYALFNVSRNCWLEYFKEKEKIATYSNNPVLVSYDKWANISNFAKSVANATGDEFTVYHLSSCCNCKPSIVSRMSVYTKRFSPKVAEFIHNTAIRFGDEDTDKIQIAKEL